MAATNDNAIGAIDPVMSVNTANLAPAAPQPLPAEETEGESAPPGTDSVAESLASQGDSSDPVEGTGVDGELSIWEARYSKRNFIGRITVRVLLTVAAAVLAYYTWGRDHADIAALAWIGIGVVALFWVTLFYRMIQAHYSHYYRLTNRRLFVSTGVVHRRRDMMELLRIKDVFTRQQSLLERWLGLGTVVVVPTEKELPTFYLAGVDDPKAVMDLIWHHARAERDHRSVKVDSV